MAHGEPQQDLLFTAPEALPQNSRMFEPAPEPQVEPAPLTYEQPLNERMRMFLRLEFLWQLVSHHAAASHGWGSRAAVAGLLEILAITSRGDPRSDALKELERQMALLRDYQNRPGVDGSRLRSVIKVLEQRRDELNAAGANFLQRLRESEFLNAIKHRSAIPGGTCEFDLPDYCHWLNLDPVLREADLGEWLATIRPLCESVSELLWITRENVRPREEIAPGGVYQIAFERDRPVQLVRVTLPGGCGLYPEVSGSHHRCSLRFLRWIGVNHRPVQADEDVRFLLTVCY
ncbi:MAG: cell division protein ZapD [Gammaproteobacteria bacterium]|nr:cell division protein ZapD [Gammaproteobacteria bacterium]